MNPYFIVESVTTDCLPSLPTESTPTSTSLADSPPPFPFHLLSSQSSNNTSNVWLDLDNVLNDVLHDLENVYPFAKQQRHNKPLGRDGRGGRSNSRKIKNKCSRQKNEKGEKKSNGSDLRKEMIRLKRENKALKQENMRLKLMDRQERLDQKHRDKPQNVKSCGSNEAEESYLSNVEHLWERLYVTSRQRDFDESELYGSRSGVVV
eukprot:226842_1